MNLKSLANKLISGLDRDKQKVGFQAFSPKTRQFMSDPLDYKFRTGESIRSSIKATAPTVAKSFGDIYRGGFTRFDRQPAKINTRIQPLLNMVANQAQTIGSGAVDIGSGITKLPSKPIKGTLQAIRGGGKLLASRIPLFTGANIASELGRKDAFGRRLATGLTRGMSQVSDLALSTQPKTIRLGKLDTGIDPAMMIGSMVGFTQNPINRQFFKLTNSILPSGKLSNLSKWLGITTLRGGIEQLMLDFPDTPKDMSKQDKITWMGKTFVIGAGQEIGGQLIGEAGSKLLKTKAGKLAIKTFDELTNAIRRLQIPETHNGITAPIWKWELGLQNRSPTEMELSVKTPEGFGKPGLDLQATKAKKTIRVVPQKELQTKTSGALRIVQPQPKSTRILSTLKIRDKVKVRDQPLEDIISQGRKQIGVTQRKPGKTIKQELNDFYTQWVDRYNPITKASKKAKKGLKGAELRPEYDPKYLVRRLTGAGGIADQRFKTELNPILKEMENLNIDKLDMDVYLANKRMAGLEGRDIYGVDVKKSKQIISALESKYQGIKELSDKLYSYQNKGFQEMIDAGFISKDVGKVIKQQNPNYSPLYRVMDEVDNYLGLPTRKAMQGTQPIIRIKGSKRKIESPVEGIIGNTFRQRAAIEKNRVAKSVVGLQNIVDMGFEKAAKSGNDTITIWNNGVKEYWKVGQDIADTAKGVNEEVTNLVLKILKAPASILRQGATGRNPDFMVSNVIRDQLDAGISSKYGYIPFIDYVSGLKSMITNDDIYKKWANSGAKIDLGEMSGKKSIKASFDTAKGKKGLFNWISKGLDVAGKYSEQPTRIGLFKKAYKKTGNEMLAMMESRDATVDFARMGSKMKVANSIIPFLNVGVQGFDKLIRATMANPGKVLFNASMYATIPALVTSIYNLQNYPEEYKEIPQWDKDSNFIIVKGRNEDGTVDYITIPKGNIVPVIANPVQSFVEFAHGNDQQSFKEMALSTLTNVLPVLGSGQSLKEIGLKTIGQNLPQAIKPITENILNKSFYRYDPKKEQTKDIVPYYLQKKPEYKQDYKFTPQMYKKIGALFNVSPLKVKNLMEGYLAGYTKIPAQIVEMLYKSGRGQKINPNEKPIMRRFLKQTYSSSGYTPKPKVVVPGLMERLTGKASAKTLFRLKSKEPDIDKYAQAYGVDISEQPKSGIAKYQWSIDRIKSARGIIDNKEIPQEIKGPLIDKMGLDKNKVYYDYLANQTTDVKAQYIYGLLENSDNPVRDLMQARKESISGKIFASDTTLKKLRDMGLITDGEYKQLKKYKFNQQGQSTGSGYYSKRKLPAGMKPQYNPPTLKVRKTSASRSPTYKKVKITTRKTPSMPKL